MPDPRDWLADPIESGRQAGFGIYLHIPFCAHRCGYCDFATYVPDSVGGQDVVDRYFRALSDEIDRGLAAAPVDGGWPEVTSVFVGGGTPTLFGASPLVELIARLRSRLDVAPDAEITVEANPETTSEPLFEELAAAGVTRVSIGAQSFASTVLTVLERGHSVDAVLQAVADARAGGIDQVSLDLIFGTPGERDEDWSASLDGVLAAGVDHVSAYALTIHDNTSFGRAVANGRMPLPDEDLQRDRFDQARDVLGGGGFEHYEVSNWALGSRARSRHNVLYWRHGDYLAFGVGAHGHLDGTRWWNTRSVPGYIDGVEHGDGAVAGREQLDLEERAAERLLLGLRLKEGLHPMDAPPIDPLALEDAMTTNLITTSCGRLQCTDDGWFLLDEAVRRLT